MQSKAIKSESKVKSEVEFESKFKYESCTDGKDISSEIVNMVKKMRRRKNFTKRGVKKEIEKKDQINKENVQCYKCNKKGNYKLECPQLKELKKGSNPKKQKKIKALKAT